jgi:hypothetical protein
VTISPVQSASQVFEAVQRVKAAAPAFCTNFFPVQARLEQWIQRRELFLRFQDQSVFFLRRENGFWRLYFCAGSDQGLGTGLAALEVVRTEPVVLDVLGAKLALEPWPERLRPAGFRSYNRLQRMARVGKAASSPLNVSAPAVSFAAHEDAPSILAVLADLFDRFADQLPSLPELEAAIKNQQVLTINTDGTIAALLLFETQGLTSAVRFWAVARAYQSRRFGAALMHHYFGLHPNVKRFNLWVGVDNQNAVKKYEHYGYSPDGLFDLILTNEKIPHENGLRNS